MTKNHRDLNFATNAIHFGYNADEANGSLTPPVYMTSAYEFENAETGQKLFQNINSGFRYGRYANPTQDILEKRLAKLENGDAALVFASGMAAIASTFWTLLKQGDEVIIDKTLYGATHSLLNKGLAKFGVTIKSVDMRAADNLASEISDKTKLIYFETPGNPNLQIIDIETISSIAHKHDAITMVDNTFASPALQNPLISGANIVVHSATKYLGGHGDLIAGALIGDQPLIDQIREEGLRFFTGATISPFTSFLLLRGLKTLSIRMEQHSNSAHEIAKFLQEHKKISSVIYPGLKHTQGHDIAKKQMKKFSGIISFEIRGTMPEAIKFMNALRLIKRAVSLGDADTLIQHPASMTHSTYSKAERIKHNISDNLLRLSIGLEEPADIINDIKQALDQ